MAYFDKNRKAIDYSFLSFQSLTNETMEINHNLNCMWYNLGYNTPSTFHLIHIHLDALRFFFKFYIWVLFVVKVIMWFCCSIADGKRTCTPHWCTVSFRISSFLLSFGLFLLKRQSHESFYTKCPKKTSFSLDRIFCFICLFLKYKSISVQK